MTTEGLIFNIQRYAIHDGAGIRTVVFFKGCPLNCLWCSNPEGIKPYRQVVYSPERCIECGVCLVTCRQGAVDRNAAGKIAHWPSKCKSCGECIQKCYSGALEIYGFKISVTQLLEEILKDRVFYNVSDGGVTLSGGEPLLQPRFARFFLEACSGAGIDSCIETSAYIPQQEFLNIALLANRIYIDIKHMDSNLHRLYTGVSNDLILSNIAAVVQRHNSVIIRIPIIPNYNDYKKNICQTISFISSLGKAVPVELLPYHRLGEHKYQKLGLFYSAHDVKPPSVSKLTEIKRMFETAGINCTVG